MRDETASPAAKSAAPASRWARLGIHARVVALAAVFGLAAYALVHVLIAVTRQWGWLDWLQR